MELETTRLRIIALDKQQLELYINDQAQLGRRLGIILAENEYEPQLQRDMEIVAKLWLSSVEQDPENYLWYTNWLIVEKASGMCIGGFCFKGPANIAGHTEIGYGLLPRYRGKGFMAEAVARLVAWAFETPALKAITAETPKDNIPSQRVLIRCGFTQYMQTEHSLFWKIAKPANHVS